MLASPMALKELLLVAKMGHEPLLSVKNIVIDQPAPTCCINFQTTPLIQTSITFCIFKHFELLKQQCPKLKFQYLF